MSQATSNQARWLLWVRLGGDSYPRALYQNSSHIQTNQSICCCAVLPSSVNPQMGPSGSSKTTLLDLLAGRKTVGRTEGSILVAGNKPTRPFLRRYTGYVEQFGECMQL